MGYTLPILLPQVSPVTKCSVSRLGCQMHPSHNRTDLANGLEPKPSMSNAGIAGQWMPLQHSLLYSSLPDQPVSMHMLSLALPLVSHKTCWPGKHSLLNDSVYLCSGHDVYIWWESVANFNVPTGHLGVLLKYRF